MQAQLSLLQIADEDGHSYIWRESKDAKERQNRSAILKLHLNLCMGVGNPRKARRGTCLHHISQYGNFPCFKQHFTDPSRFQ
jgi:hypothetical protein